MFKEIIAISKNYAIVKIDNVITDDLLNLNVVFEENNKKILGEVEEIMNGEAKISFLGEFHGSKFYDGIIRKPSINSKIRIINAEELAELTGYNDNTAMMLGLSPLYNDSPIKINIDDMWSNHSAIFGNTGSGKTYGVARLVQNLFTMPNYIPFNSIIFIFNKKLIILMNMIVLLVVFLVIIIILITRCLVLILIRELIFLNYLYGYFLLMIMLIYLM